MWTADVASGGRRFVDHQPIDRPPTAGNGLAVASMVCGITGLTLAWLPFVGVFGAAASIVAVVLGIIGLRRAHAGAERHGFALAGTITGALGIVATALGIWLTVRVLQVIDEYQHPGPVDAEVTECTDDGNGRVNIVGTLTNGSDDERSYSVRIEISGGRGARRVRVDVDDVPAARRGTSRRPAGSPTATSRRAGSCPSTDRSRSASTSTPRIDQRSASAHRRAR